MIRKCYREDLPQIYNLVKELAIFEKEPEAVVATIEEYYHNYDNGLIDVLVIEINNVVIGMALYYATFSTWKGRMLYLEDFIIKQEYRSAGYGQQLFDAFLDEAKRQGCRLVKWQVLDWNIDAIRFYERNGALIEKNWWNGKMILHKDI
jgi:GNAT superfamily N-acetyltransferase